MKNVLLPVLLLTFLISSQTKKPAGGLDQTITIDLTESVESQGPAGDWIEDLQFIQLETNPDCFISSTYRSNLNRDYIVVASDGAVHLFDRSGKHLKSIKRFGKGPGEYGNSIRVDLIPDRDEIMVVSTNERKIICYDYSGNLVDEIHLPFMPTTVAPVAGGLFACYVGRMLGFWGNKPEPDQVVFLSREGQIVSKYLPFKYFMQSGTGCGFSYSGEEGTYFINPSYCLDIYQAGPGDQFFKKYRFDFGHFNPDTSLLNNEKVMSDNNPGQYFNDKIKYLQEMTITTNTISFWGPVNQNTMRLGTRQINRTTGHVRFMELDSLNSYDFYNGLPIDYSNKSSGDYFFFFKDAVDLIDILKKLTSDQKRILSKFKGFDRLAKLKEDDNPVLVLYKVKDF
ncbi:MAG: 6-bladed beta-propeller [Bacteroidia bacterium]|nr:6-bladed beta-propeller [Bacteroidia bacterium]